MKFIVLSICVLIGLTHCSKFDLPEPETTCYFFVGCDFFPPNKICGLARDGCYGPHTFGNDCELSVYNCEHPSNEFYKYWDGACYPEEELITISPIETVTAIPIDSYPPVELITISPIETVTATPIECNLPEERITISPIERVTARPIKINPREDMITISPIERVTARPINPREDMITISPIERVTARPIKINPREGMYTISPIERVTAGPIYY